jgi:hypothetical protein
MSMPGRQLITRAVFAVAIVASTGAVGAVGFAQAAQPKTQQVSGYGGGIPALLEAVKEFRQSVQTATNQYRQDVNACIDGTQTAMKQKGSLRPSSAADSQFDTAKSKFDGKVDQTVNTLSSRVNDERQAQAGGKAFENTFNSAANDAVHQLNDAQGQLATDLGASASPAASQGSLFQCLDNARDKYRASLDAAKAKLIEAIREILGS